MTTTSQILLDRYAEAMQEPTIGRWRSLAYWAGFIADDIDRVEPKSEVGDDIRTISQLAWQHAMDMCPPRDEADYESLSGVIVGWFRGLFKGAAA